MGSDIDWGLLVRNLGVPGAMLSVLLYFLYRGWLYFKPEGDRRDKEALAMYNQLEARRVSENKVWEERFNQLRDDATERITNLRVEKDMWRDTALKSTNTAVEAAKKVPVPT